MPDDETQASSEELDDVAASTSGSSRRGWGAGLLRKSATPRPPRPALPPRAVKAIVDGLDTTERNLGIAAVVLALVLDGVNFYVNRHSPTKSIRSAADFTFISNLIFAGILALGLGIRRRALLGFGAFFFGLEQAFTERELQLGLPFLVFGGWLILRASQKQKQARPTPGAKASTRSSTAKKSSTPNRPKASKRYTPPQRARGSSAR